MVSMPKLPEPNPNMTQEQALTMILSSIALEEAALAHIMNAEGEKIQYMLNRVRRDDCSASINNIFEVNKSVTNLLETVQQNQTILRNKMEKVLEYLPKPTHLPKPPGPPVQDCATPDGMPVCFCVVPGAYRCDEPLIWSEKNVCGHTATYSSDSSKILLPTVGPLLLGFCAKTRGALGRSDVLELVITCEGMDPIQIKTAPGRWDRRRGFYKKILLEMPHSCKACHAVVFVRARRGMHLKQGGFFFTRFQAGIPETKEMEQA